MKIRKEYIQKLIKEEIRRVLYGDPIKQKVIHLFVKARNGMDDPANKENVIQNLIKSLKDIGVIPNKAIDSLLDSEEIDQNFYIRCVQIHNEIVKLIGGKEKNINAFAHFPRIDHDPDIDQDPDFLRSPQSIQARDQEDTRKHIKNLIQP